MQVTAHNLTRTITTCFKDAGLHDLVDQIARGIVPVRDEHGAGGAAAIGSQQNAPAHNLAHAPLPAEWVLPGFSAVEAWLAWVVGGDGHGPYRDLQGIPDAQHGIFKAYKRFTAIIERCIIAKTHTDIDWSTLDENTALDLYAQVKGDIEQEGPRHRRRHGQLKWNTVLKNFEKARADRNKRARLDEPA